MYFRSQLRDCRRSRCHRAAALASSPTQGRSPSLRVIALGRLKEVPHRYSSVSQCCDPRADVPKPVQKRSSRHTLVGHAHPQSAILNWQLHMRLYVSQKAMCRPSASHENAYRESRSRRASVRRTDIRPKDVVSRRKSQTRARAHSFQRMCYVVACVC
jgi:hypothetical protein